MLFEKYENIKKSFEKTYFHSSYFPFINSLFHHFLTDQYQSRSLSLSWHYILIIQHTHSIL